MEENLKTVSKLEILEMARQLGIALASSEEIKHYRETEALMVSDSEACRLTHIFKQKHRAVAELSKEPNYSEDEFSKLTAEIEKADQDMKAYPLLADYYQAGAAFNNLIYQINQLLKFYSMEPDESDQFPSSGGCGGCGSHR